MEGHHLFLGFLVANEIRDSVPKGKGGVEEYFLLELLLRETTLVVLHKMYTL